MKACRQSMQSMFCKTGVQNPGLHGVLELASAVGFSVVTA